MLALYTKRAGFRCDARGASVRKGMLAEDVIEELKQIEKRSKSLSSELSP